MADNTPIFRISASVVKQLGEELVSDELTAIMELVKNSYDADADWVKITINTNEILKEDGLIYQNSKGHIVIEDNGDGMNYNDIINKWLFISVSHKRDMKAKGLVTGKQRTPLGDKGLGRLSTQRLAQVLEIFTGKNDEKISHHVAFDWRDFTDSSGLEKVETNYSTQPKSLEKKGTKLILTDLKNPDIWLGEAGDKFRGQLSKLIFPFREIRPFNIYLNINGEKIDLDEINEKLRQLAISRYKFTFDGKILTVEGKIKFAKLQGNDNNKKEIFNNIILNDRGKEFFSFLTNKEINKDYFIPDITYVGESAEFFSFKRVFEYEKDIKVEMLFDAELKKNIPANPGEFIGEIDEFNLSGTDEIESAYDSLSEYKLLVKNQVGVRIFRDGFGIKPYGMNENDWLKLSKSQTSGGSFYLLRPQNVIGFVSITAKENKHLTEKTDREGFIDSPYSKNFFNLIDLAVSNINGVLDRTRRSYDGFKKKDASIKGNINSFDDIKERLLNTATRSNEIEKETSTIRKDLKNTSAKVTAAVDKIKNEPLFTSTEENKALAILEEVDNILKNANQLFDKILTILASAKKLEYDANYLEPRINELENQIVQFSELASLGITAEAFTHEMYNTLDRLSLQTENISKQLKKDYKGNTPFFVYAEHVKSYINSIRKQLNHLAPSLKFNKETRQEIKLSTFINEIKDYYSTRNLGKINIAEKITEDFTINLNRGKLTQIFDNILLNSEYWLLETLNKDSSFKPEVIIEIKAPNIYISDNGYGILPTIETTLFQPFVTTKPKGKGRGLGLFIVRQLLDSVHGNIVLSEKKNQYDRRYIFNISFEKL